MYYTFFPPNPLVIMVCIMLYRETIGVRRERLRKSREASTLATALAVELQNLLEHYSDNIALLDRGAGVFLSVKTPGAVFRSSSGRLAGLFDERVLVPVVKAYSNHDRIEAVLQAFPKPQGGRPPQSDVETIYVGLLRERFGCGVELVEAAICAITLTWPISSSENSILTTPMVALASP